LRIAAKDSKEPQQRFKSILAEPLAKIFLQLREGKYFPISAENGVFQQNMPFAAIHERNGSCAATLKSRPCCQAQQFMSINWRQSGQT